MPTAFLTPAPTLHAASASAFATSSLSSRRPLSNVPFQPAVRRSARPSVQMVDTSTVAGVLAGVAGLGGGVALVAWTENQGTRTDTRVNTQVCFECKGETRTICTVCNGSKVNPLNEAEPCTHCDGVGTVVCMNCGGTGIQPRFLDRLSPEDFMD